MITLYTTHCPKCRTLEKNIKKKGIPYTTSENLDKLVRAGFSSAPMLEVAEGQFLNFKEAWGWINQQ